MGLDNEHSVNPGVDCGENIHYNSSHSNFREQDLVQDVLGYFHYTPICLRNRPYHCCMGAVHSSPGALEPYNTGKSLEASNPTGSSLSASMFIAPKCSRYESPLTSRKAMFTFSDLTYVLIPILIIWDLQMSLQKKIGLGLVLSLGLLSVFSI